MTTQDARVAHPARVLAPDGTPALRPTRTGVPWGTVLPLAIVLAFADGFWMTSLRGAVGYIERTQTPFTSWLRESALAVPLFVLAVLGALTLALHWFGPNLRGRSVLAAMGLVAAAATVVGFAEIAASSAYDYHLQVRQLQTMHDMCTTTGCEDQRLQASLQLQVRAVGMASLLLLATNLVVVGWVVALSGGRLNVTRIRRPHGRSGRVVTAAARLDTRSWALVTALAGSAVIHAAVVPEHVTEWPAAAGFFVGLAAAQVTMAAMVVLDVRASLRLAAAVSLAPLLLWLYSRTAGMPFGPEVGTPEHIGLADVAAGLLELVALVLAVLLLRARGRASSGTEPRDGRPARWPSAHLRALVVIALVAVTSIGVAGSGLAWFDVVSAGDWSEVNADAQAP